MKWALMLVSRLHLADLWFEAQYECSIEGMLYEIHNNPSSSHSLWQIIRKTPNQESTTSQKNYLRAGICGGCEGGWWKEWDVCLTKVRALSAHLPNVRAAEEALSVYLQTYHQLDIKWVEEMERKGVQAGEMAPAIHLINRVRDNLARKGKAILSTLDDLQKAAEATEEGSPDIKKNICDEFKQWVEQLKKDIEVWQGQLEKANKDHVTDQIDQELNTAIQKLHKTGNDLSISCSQLQNSSQINKIKMELDEAAEKLSNAKATIFLRGLRNSLSKTFGANDFKIDDTEYSHPQLTLDEFVWLRLADFKHFSKAETLALPRSINKLIDPSALEGVYASFVMCHVAGTILLSSLAHLTSCPNP